MNSRNNIIQCFKCKNNAYLMPHEIEDYLLYWCKECKWVICISKKDIKEVKKESEAVP